MQKNKNRRNSDTIFKYTGPVDDLPVVPAGFPSPADGHLEKPLDLNDYVVEHPAATFFMRVEGDSMVGAGIHNGDVLAVDRLLRPASGSVIVAILDGRFTVKRLVRSKAGWRLDPANPLYPSIAIRTESDFEVWGVVTYTIHKVV